MTRRTSRFWKCSFPTHGSEEMFFPNKKSWACGFLARHMSTPPIMCFYVNENKCFASDKYRSHMTNKPRCTWMPEEIPTSVCLLFVYRGVNAKWFYLKLNLIAQRTLLLSTLKLSVICLSRKYCKIVLSDICFNNT